MTKVSKMEFEFEFPDEYSDEEVEERTIEMVMESLQDNHTNPEITVKETDPFLIAVQDQTERVKRDMMACAYNVARGGGLNRDDYPEITRLAKIFTLAYGMGMSGSGWEIGLTPKDKEEARNMRHFF